HSGAPLPSAALDEAHLRASRRFFQDQPRKRRASRNKRVRDIPIFVASVEINPETRRWILKHWRRNLREYAPLFIVPAIGRNPIHSGAPHVVKLGINGLE